MKKYPLFLTGILLAAGVIAQEDYQRNVFIGSPASLSIAKGEFAGHSRVNKFGNAPDFDTGDLEVTIWDASEDGTAWENMTNDYSTTADIDRISSDSASDTVVIELQGLGASTNLVVQNVTLNGTNKVTITTPLYRIFRGKNIGAANLVGHVFAYPDGAASAGIPDTNGDIRMVIHPENNQTEMALYTIPAGKTGYMRAWYVGTTGAIKTSNYLIMIYARPPGQVFQLKHKGLVNETGNSYIQHFYQDPPSYVAGTDIEMRAKITAGSVTAASVMAGFDLVLVDD